MQLILDNATYFCIIPTLYSLKPGEPIIEVVTLSAQRFQANTLGNQRTVEGFLVCWKEVNDSLGGRLLRVIIDVFRGGKFTPYGL